MGDKPEANIDEAALISAVREGSLAAYGLLYAEFRPMALRRARRLLGKHHDDAEDVVEMAFASILDAIRNGAGPEDNFTRYLMVTLRHSAWRVSRRRDREAPLRASHLDDLAYDPQHDHVQPEAVDRGSEVADQRDLLTSSEAAFVGRLDPSTLLSQAFTGLTERHRAALWMCEVEGKAPAELATLLGLSDNAASALRYRARKSLRANYFLSYSKVASPDCLEVADRLPTFVEAGMTSDAFPDVLEHVSSCGECRDAVRGVTETSALLSVMAPFGILSVGYWLRPDRSSLAGGAAAGTAAGAGTAGAVALLTRALWIVVTVVGLIGAGLALGRCGTTPEPVAAPPSSSVRSDTAIASEPPRTSLADPPETTSSTPTRSSSQPAQHDPTVGSVSGVLHIDRDGSGPGPVSDASAIPISLTPADGGRARHVITGTDGRYVFDRLPPGTYELEAMVPVGLAPEGSTHPHPLGGRPQTIVLAVPTVEAGVRSDVDLLLVPWRSFAVSSIDVVTAPGKVDDTVSWRLALTSGPAASSAVRVDLSMGWPRGVPFRGATVSVGDASLSPEAEGAGTVPCEVRVASDRLQLVCTLSRLTPRRSTLTLSLRFGAGSSGVLRPFVAVASARGFVNAASLEGPPIVLG